MQEIVPDYDKVWYEYRDIANIYFTYQFGQEKKSHI